MGKLKRFLQISSIRKRLLVEAAFYSGIYRYQVMHKPFKEIAPSIGTFQYETEEKEITDSILKDIRWAVEVMAYHVPWKSQCMDRALAAKKMLNRRGFPCTLYMGLIRNEKKEMTAHAWLRCGTKWISGGDGKGYAVTGIYGDKR